MKSIAQRKTGNIFSRNFFLPGKKPVAKMCPNFDFWARTCDWGNFLVTKLLTSVTKFNYAPSFSKPF